MKILEINLNFLVFEKIFVMKRREGKGKGKGKGKEDSRERGGRGEEGGARGWYKEGVDCYYESHGSAYTNPHCRTLQVCLLLVDMCLAFPPSLCVYCLFLCVRVYFPVVRVCLVARFVVPCGYLKEDR